MKLIILALALLYAAQPVAKAEKMIRVFVALCDNKSQGIQPVPAKIGDGDQPETNLYWGCDDGFGAYFRRCKEWKPIETASDISPVILHRATFHHVTRDVRLTAEAYRGSAMRQCLEDFEKAAAADEYDLVAFIGHNGLMDFALPEQPPVPKNRTAAIVLCCMSDQYFSPRLEKLGCQPLLLTQQLMYPGSFILHDALNVWLKGGNPAEMRAAAGSAYARNQKISVRAATGVFAAPRLTGGRGEELAPGSSRTLR